MKMMTQVLSLFREYMGEGLITGWFLLSVVYLMFQEKRRQFRILFVYVPVILLLLFFNPLFARLLYHFSDAEIYYRILWLLPVTMGIGAAAVHLYGALKGKMKLAAAGVYAVLIMVSGSYIYSNPYFTRAENLYHVPQTVVEICDAIELEGREVMAAFPAQMLQYVRQYSPVVCMPYGREQLVARWGFADELFSEMEAPVADAERLAMLAKERGCHYVILPQEKEIEGSLLSYDYVVLDTIDGYVIYMDTTMDYRTSYEELP